MALRVRDRDRGLSQTKPQLALTTSMTSLAVYESSPDVGSSRNNTRGLLTNAMPTFVRFACGAAAACTQQLDGPRTVSR